MNRRDSLKILVSREAKESNSNNKKCIVGIGRGACNIIDHISEIDSDFDFIYIHGYLHLLQKVNAKQNVKQMICLEMLEKTKKRFFGCIDDSLFENKSITKNQHDTSKRVAEYKDADSLFGYNSVTKNQIKELVNIQSELFMIVTLGGKVGGGESQKILKYLSKQGKNVNLIAVMPFKFNGKRKNRQAIEAFEELKRYASKVYVFQNDDFATEQYKKLTVNELYPIISASIYDTIFKSISL